MCHDVSENAVCCYIIWQICGENEHDDSMMIILWSWDHLFFPRQSHVQQLFRLSTAGDLVASAAEGPERLKTELKLYRQQLEQAGCRLCWLCHEKSKKEARYGGFHSHGGTSHMVYNGKSHENG